MEVVARLTAPLLAHLQLVLDRAHQLVVADDWTALDRLIRARPIDLAVIDPRADGTARTDEIHALLVAYRSLPIVLYMPLAPEALRITVELAKYGLPQVVLRGFDDEPHHFRALLDRQPARAIESALLGRIAEHLTHVPPGLAKAINDLFLMPHTFQNVDHLASAAGLTRRSLDRSLDRAGLASARTLVTGAKVARAYHYLRDPGYMIDDVTRKLAYPSPRLLARQVRWATGRSPSALRKHVEPEQFITELAARLRREGDQDNGTHNRR